MRISLRSLLRTGLLLIGGSFVGMTISFFSSQVFVTKLNIQIGTFGIATYEDGYVLATKGYTGNWNTIEDIRVVQKYLTQEFRSNKAQNKFDSASLRGVSVRKSRSVTIEVEATSAESAAAYAQMVGQHLVDRHQLMLDEFNDIYWKNNVSEISKELNLLLGQDQAEATAAQPTGESKRLINTILEEYQSLLARTRIYTEPTKILKGPYSIIDQSIPTWAYMFSGALLSYLTYVMLFGARRVWVLVRDVPRVLWSQSSDPYD